MIKVEYNTEDKTFKIICPCCKEKIIYKSDINKYKTNNVNRSSMEEYIEEYLNEKYNFLEILYNNKINEYELDVYIPSLSLAIEINGITHYNNIHGNNTLAQVATTDFFKYKMCKDNNINLISIDIVHIKNFKNSSIKKKHEKMQYIMSDITNIIDEELDNISYIIENNIKG
jgi:hypothetical protein